MTVFETWYKETITQERLSYYSLETLLKWAFIAGATAPDKNSESIFLREEDEDKLLSPELEDSFFRENHPELELKDDSPDPTLNLTQEQLDELNAAREETKKRIEEYKKNVRLQ